MNSTTPVSVGGSRTLAASSNPARWLHAAFAALLFALMLLGFQQFYLHGRAYPGHEIPPPVKTVLVLHGVGMTTWMILFLVQPLLIATGNRRLHMSLGIVGATVAAVLVVLGLYVPIAVARVEPDIVLWGLHRQQFMAIPFGAILLFGAFVAIGVRYRRRPEIHRPMMVLATLSVVTAAIDRITGVPDLWAPTIWGHWFGPFFASLVLGTGLLLVKALLTRSFDKTLALGLIVMAVSFALIMRVAPTHAWASVTHFLVG